MPTYTYQCLCGTTQELQRPIEDRNKRAPCTCGAWAIRIQDRPPGFSLKGAGWTRKPGEPDR